MPQKVSHFLKSTVARSYVTSVRNIFDFIGQFSKIKKKKKKRAKIKSVEYSIRNIFEEF